VRSLAEEIEEFEQLQRANPLAAFMANPPCVGGWGAASWQREFFYDQHPQISLLGGNKIGKSTALAGIVWAFMLDMLPGWPLPKGRQGVVVYMAADLENAYADDVCRSLHDFHTPAIVASNCTYSEERGYYTGGRRMLVTNRARVAFRSGLQDPQAVAGLWGDLIIVNELPTARHWGELMRSSTRTEEAARIRVGFTALPPETVRHNDDLSWYWDEIDNPRKGWKEYVIPLSAETTPHRSDQSRATQIQRTKPWEVAQRIHAARYGPAPGRRLSNFDDERCIFTGETLADLPGLRHDDQVMIGLGFDHGELTGRQTCILGAWVERPDGPRAWAIDCYVSSGRTTTAQDASEIASMISRHGLSLLNVDRAIGDVNSAGKSSPFEKVNHEFTAEFKALAGTRSAPFTLKNADKRPGSVKYGLHVLNESFGREVDGSPAFMVHERCTPLLASFRRYSEKAPKKERDKHGHLLDTSRYLFVPILETAWPTPDLRSANEALAEEARAPWLGQAPADWSVSSWDGNA